MEAELPSSYRMQYNLNIQHEILGNTLITVGYVGARGVHLSRVSRDTNLHTPIVQDGRLFFPEGQSKPNPAFSAVRFVHFDASSFYNAFQLGVNRRFSEGLQIQGAYTVGKSIDDGSTTTNAGQFTNGVSNPFPLIRELGRGLSDYDIRQSLVINGTWDLPLKVGVRPGNLSTAGSWEVFSEAIRVFPLAPQWGAILPTQGHPGEEPAAASAPIRSGQPTIRSSGTLGSGLMRRLLPSRKR